VRRLAVTDAGVIVIAVAIAQLARFGTDLATFRSESLVYSYTAVSAVLILAWFSVLVLFRSREPKVVVSTGVEEFRRVARASITLFGSVAIISFLLKLEWLAATWQSPFRWAWQASSSHAGYGGDGSRENGLKDVPSPPCSWSVLTTLLLPWQRNSRGWKPRDIESLESVSLVGEPARATLSMLTGMRFLCLVMRPL
jgi:hypothetical protein